MAKVSDITRATDLFGALFMNLKFYARFCLVSQQLLIRIIDEQIKVIQFSPNMPWSMKFSRDFANWRFFSGLRTGSNGGENRAPHEMPVIRLIF